MPRGNWGILAAALLGLIAFAAIGGYVLASGQRHGDNYEAIGGHPRSGQFRDQPPQAAVDRAGLPRLVERAISNPQPESGNDQEKRDLAAQEATATFTFWMVVIAAFQTVVAAIGIYYIRQSLRQSDKALRHAEDAAIDTLRIGQAQIRCYPSIKSASVKIDNYCTIAVTIVLVNSGQSPARDFRWSHDVKVRTTRPEWEWTGDRAGLYESSPTRDVPVGETPPLTQITIGRSLSEDDAVTLREAAAVWFWVSILLSWRDVFGLEFVETHHMQAGRGMEIIGVDIPLSPASTAIERKK